MCSRFLYFRYIYIATLYKFRVQYGKVRLKLRNHLNYYINLSEDKHDVQLLITSIGTAEGISFQEMAELIIDINNLLDNIMRIYMPAAKRPTPTPFIPYPLYASDLLLSATGN